MNQLFKSILILSIITLISCNNSDDFFKVDVSAVPISGSEKDPSSLDNAPDEENTSGKHVDNDSGTLEEISQVFYQKELQQNKADLLWVIDNSLSMQNEQKELGSYFKDFIKTFVEKKIDFKIGITTAESSFYQDGHMIGNFNNLTLAAHDKNPQTFYAHFSQAINITTERKYYEQGIRASVRFLGRYAEDFLRNDSNLIIIYISDEEDQSPLKVKEYLKMTQSYKSNPGLVKAFSIINTSLIGSTDENESIGRRYMEISKATTANHASIKSNFKSLLNNLGESITALIESFSLAATPYKNKITVLVDEVKIDKGFVYNSESRTIKFTENSIPEPGSKIEVRYFTAK